MQDCIAPQTAVVQYNLLSLPVSETLLAVHAGQGEKCCCCKDKHVFVVFLDVVQHFFLGGERESCLLAAGKRLNFDSILVKPGKL